MSDHVIFSRKYEARSSPHWKDGEERMLESWHTHKGHDPVSPRAEQRSQGHGVCQVGTLPSQTTSHQDNCAVGFGPVVSVEQVFCG